jgi:hypothetical protein
LWVQSSLARYTSDPHRSSLTAQIDYLALSRLVLLLMRFFSTYLQRAFHGGLLVPILGFIFLPLTTIVYVWELNNGMPTSGINLLWLLIAVIIDLGGPGGGASSP